MSVGHRIASRLLEREQSRIRVGDLVSDCAVDVPHRDVGRVRKIRGSLAFVEWRDGAYGPEHVDGLIRVAEKFKHPLPDPEVLAPPPDTLVRVASQEVWCGVAATPESRREGLQRYAYLPPNRGLLFPFGSARRVAFHMGDVSFPIDVIFIAPAGDHGRIARIVSDAQPGHRGSWVADGITAVLEVAGGSCRSWGVRVGDAVAVDLRATHPSRSASLRPPGPVAPTYWFGPDQARHIVEDDQGDLADYGGDDPSRPIEYAPSDGSVHDFRTTSPADHFFTDGEELIGHYSESQGQDPTSDPDEGVPTRPG